MDLPMAILEGDHSMPPSSYGSVKAYTNFDAECDALNIVMAIKTTGVDEVTTVEGPKRNLHQH
ncbi:hypothetical protein GH733_018567 [Mirounga leonina]|nr:hypothetical protein GH733_018567 [Mirounga leonina]